MNYAPILVFVYNRPLHTRQLITSLQKNTLAADSRLIIYSDNNRSEQDAVPVKEVRKYIHTITGFKEIQIIERTENYGLARNIIDGVTTQIKKHGRVIVLEDDLLVAPYFLQFMNDALEVYKDEPRVGHIQAYNYVNQPPLPDTFLIKFTGSWGWATWERAWQCFNPDGQELLNELEARKLTGIFDFNGTYKYTRMLRRQVKGQNNSWAIRWNASLFLKDILSLNAGKSLVQNSGFDGTGTNCGSGNLYGADLWDDPLPIEKIQPIEENELARKAYEQYYRKTNSFTAKAIRRIKRTLKGDFGA